MSGVKNITLSYQEYKSYVRQNKDSRLVNRSYSMDPANGQGDGSLLEVRCTEMSEQVKTMN